jgi:glyoxalase superfamily protein
MFKSLCVDAVDTVALGSFWSAALGLEVEDGPNGGVVLVGTSAAHTVRIVRAPEPKAVKHGVHLDIHGNAIGHLEAIGATVIEARSFPWIVMADPEGGEFCVFPGETAPRYRLHEVVIDCVDHVAISSRWAMVMGGERRTDAREFSCIERIPGVPFDAVSFVPVEEAKKGKNRVRLDLVAERVDALVAAGATLLRAHDDERDETVLADPKGNEFGAFPSG